MIIFRMDNNRNDVIQQIDRTYMGPAPFSSESSEAEFELMLKDNTHFCKYFWNLIINYHVIAVVVYKKSLFSPIYLRSSLLFLNIMLLLNFNALLFSDKYLLARLLSTAPKVINYLI